MAQSSNTSLSGASGINEAYVLHKRKADDPQPSVLTLDNHGDLRFEVGEGSTQRAFIVCSRSVARVSKPFQAMLFGRFAEAKQNNGADWTIALPEDNAEGFTIILYIVHANFNMIPATVSRDLLYEITVLTHKYDMTEVLQPWTNAWLAPFAIREPQESGDEKFIWIAWELGHKNLFLLILNHYLFRSSTGKNLPESADSDEIMVLPYPSMLDGQPMNDNILVDSLGVCDQIVAQRETAIVGLFEMVQEKITDLMPIAPKHENGAATMPFRDCRPFHLGCLIQGLASRGLYPLPSAATYAYDVQWCQRSLCDAMVKVQMANDVGGDPFNRGSPASSLAAKIRGFTPAFTLTCAQDKHLAEQASRSGLNPATMSSRARQSRRPARRGLTITRFINSS